MQLTSRIPFLSLQTSTRCEQHGSICTTFALVLSVPLPHRLCSEKLAMIKPIYSWTSSSISLRQWTPYMLSSPANVVEVSNSRASKLNENDQCYTNMVQKVTPPCPTTRINIQKGRFTTKTVTTITVIVQRPPRFLIE